MFDKLLDELYKYTELENEGIDLTKIQNERYIKIVKILNNKNIEIPFGIEI